MWPFKKKEKPVLVKTLEAYVTISDYKEKETIFYYLFEDKTGNRSVQWKSTHINGVSYGSVPATHPHYLKNIVPWLNGQDYQDIPTYWDIKEENNAEYIQEMYRRILEGAG